MTPVTATGVGMPVPPEVEAGQNAALKRGFESLYPMLAGAWLCQSAPVVNLFAEVGL